MPESGYILSILCNLAPYAHYIIFGLLILAGLNFPISEDILVVTGGVIASTYIPDHWLRLYLWIYFGTWISAWLVYWTGRYFGQKLYRYQLFKRHVSKERVEKLHDYYEKFGVLTFIIGRFIPGGVRNALFLSCGLGKMHFLKFILRDSVASFTSSIVLFSIGFYFAKNYQLIANHLRSYNVFVFVFLLLAFGTTVCIGYMKKRNLSIENAGNQGSKKVK